MRTGIKHKTQRERNRFYIQLISLLFIEALIWVIVGEQAGYIEMIGMELFPELIVALVLLFGVVKNKTLKKILCSGNAVWHLLLPFLDPEYWINYELMPYVIIGSVVGTIISIILYRENSIGKGKIYLTKETTPLKWYYFFTYINAPLTILLSCSTLMNNISANNAGYSVHLLDMVFPIIYSLLAIVVIIGLHKFKKYGWYITYIYWVMPIIYHGIIVILYMEYNIELNETMLGNLAGATIMFLLNAIYFWKRRYLFLPYNLKMDETIEYPEDDIVPRKRILLKKNSNKSSLEELRLLKELLDNDAITEEEYKEKKSSILNKIN